MAESSNLKTRRAGDTAAAAARPDLPLTWLPSARALGADGLSVYRAELSHALSEYGSGRVEEAKVILARLLNSLEQPPAAKLSGVDRAQFHLLWATALTAMGRVCERLGQDREAKSAFKKAAAEFSTWIPQTREPTAQAYCDYGVALFKIGSRKRTVEAFEQAQRTGPLSAEAHRYVGICLSRERKFQKAKKHFGEALRQDPADYLTLKAVAEALEEQKKKSAAVGEYHKAAFYMATSGLVDEAMAVLEHATKLAPRDPRPPALKGEILLAQGQHEEALKVLDEGLKRRPDNALALGVKGKVLLTLGRSEEAVDYLHRALKLEPTLEWAQLDLASALYKLREFKEELRVLNKVLAKRPKNLDALMFKGDTLVILGSYEEAVNVLNRALKVSPNDPHALALKGRALNGLKQSKKALHALQRSVELDATRPSVYIDLAEAHHALGQYEKVIEELDKALAIKPDYIPALISKAEALRLVDKFEDALHVLNQALTLAPKDGWLLGTKGQVLRSLGRPERAVEVLEQAVEAAPELAWAQAELAYALYSLGEYNGAVRALNRALLEQEHVNWLAFKGHVLCEIAEFREAVKALSRATKLNPRNAQAFGVKGWALEFLGPRRVADALKAYQTALRLEPENLWWRVGIANSLYLKQDLDKAAEEYRRVSVAALKLVEDEKNPEIISLVGWCEYRLGNFEDATRLFYEAIALKPEHIHDQLNLALTLACGGRHEEALREYRQALKKAQEKPPLRLRGLAFMALDDLKLAVKMRPDLANVCEVQEIIALLDTAYKEQERHLPIAPQQG